MIRESLSSTNVAEAEAIVQQLYPVAAIREAAQPFRFAQAVRGDRGVALARFQCSNEARFEVEFQDVAALGLVLGGRYEARTATTAIDTDAPFVFQHGVGASTSTDMDLLMINIAPEALAPHVAPVHDVAVRFDGTRPRTAELERLWRHTATSTARMMWDDATFDNPLARTSALDLLTATAVAAFPLSATTSDLQRIPSAAVGRARAYLEEHAAEPVSISDAAAAARLSVRGLHAAFQRELDTSPARYLRSLRLDRARAELLAADPSVTSVAAIADRWGFAHHGRFADHYRRAFGTHPSTDLRR